MPTHDWKKINAMRLTPIGRAKLFASRHSENFLAGEIDGKIVGFGVLRINNPDEGEMFLGGIHPDFQGQGIYHSFLCKGMEWCLSKNAKRMVIFHPA